MMNFSTRLKEEIEFADIRYKELSEKSGVPERALYNYVATKNPSMPPADVAVKIAQVLGVSVEYLVTGKKSDVPYDDSYREVFLFNKYKSFIKKIENLPEEAKNCLAFLADNLRSESSL